MLTVRPIAPADAAAFAALHGACDAAAFARLVAGSQAAFTTGEATTRRHVFVLSESEPAAGDRAPAGLLGAGVLAGRSGLDWPRYSFRRGIAVHASAELKMFNAAETLVLSNDHTGCAEIGLPFMASADAGRAPERLLIDAMLLYVALHPDRFAGTLVAELPGIVTANGNAPFWLGLGRHFHAGEVPREDPFLPSPARSHIARLLPKHPLYSSFLGGDAQACIGQRALAGRTAAEALHAQGFRYRNHVAIVDGGPVVEAEVEDLRAVRASRSARVHIGAVAAPQACLVAAGSDLDFRCGLVEGALASGAWSMRAEAARVFAVGSGERVRVMPQPAPPEERRARP